MNEDITVVMWSQTYSHSSGCAGVEQDETQPLRPIHAVNHLHSHTLTEGNGEK